MAYLDVSEKNYGRIIAVGDLHGYCTPLRELLIDIQIKETDLIVFIGDYIDRGPESKSVIEDLIRLKLGHPNLIFLKGNHEDMMLGAMGFNAVIKDLRTWLYNGGTKTLISYGMNINEVLSLQSLKGDPSGIRRIMEIIPPDHVEFLEGLCHYVETENFFLCHAGVNPGSTIGAGKNNLFDLLWMRDHIYSEELRWEKTVVCGHTPMREVLIKEKLIAIDTGLFCYGTLSAVDVLTHRLYQVQRF
jgi:serine/threonine protein phosphatase 1